MNKEFNEMIKSVSEKITERHEQVNLIFYAVYGFFKFHNYEVEPELICHGVETELNDNILSYRTTYSIEIEGESYPVLLDAGTTILNILRKRGENK